MISLNYFYQNSFSRFLRYFEKTAKTPPFSARLQYLMILRCAHGCIKEAPEHSSKSRNTQDSNFFLYINFKNNN